MIKKLLLFLTILGLFSSCKKDANDGNAYIEDFETIWHNYDRYYVFFDYKNIDWTAAYNNYYPQVEKVANYNDFVGIVKNMLVPLKDVHVWIQKNNNQRVQPYFPNNTVNWDSEIWQNNISDYNWHQESSSWGWFKQDSIGYITISKWNKDEILIDDFDATLDSMRNCKGVIIDIRMNGGGYGPLAGSIGGRFVTGKFNCGYIQYRNGDQHSDLTNFEPIEYPKRGDWQYTKPIILLIGKGCFSTSEIFAAGMKNLPNCIIIGDATGGGLSNSKQFTLSDGTIYTISDQLISDTDKNIVELNGISPQIYINWNIEDVTQGIDPVFNYALDLLKNE